jgi:putative CocE/NonD family hydrolase
MNWIRRQHHFLLGRLCLAAVLTAPAAWAQGLEYIRSNYTKYEYRIPMRDGVKLFTAVYVPKSSSEAYPILLNRTPYSLRPYGPDRYRESFGGSEKFAREGYIFAYQDVRGRWQSEGTFTHVTPHKPLKRGPADVDESTDTYDTIEWLVKNVPNNNGRVGLLGISYPGFYAAAGMIDSHPALKAVSPQAPVLEWFIGDDFRHNGALYLTHAFNFLAGFDRPYPEPGGFQPGVFDAGTQDGYRFFLEAGPLANLTEKYFKGVVPYWSEVLEHDTYDEYWKVRNLLPHLKNIRSAVMTVGGWFDAEDLYGPLHVYEAVERNNPGISNMLVVGPWFHGGWWRSDGDLLGNARFGSKTGIFYREEIEFPFFDYHLKAKGEIKLPEAFIFETGTNVWRRFDTWPPAAATPRRLYFHGGGRLSADAPAASSDAFDEYLADPSKPVPYIPGIALRMTREHMTDDQRFASMRPDVLTYETDALGEDLTIAGPISVELHVSTTGTDSDWVVKLIDVYPNDYPNPDPNPAGVQMGGYQQLVRGEPFRGKFRNSYETPEPFTPGKVERVRFTMPDASHTFRRGHRIMVQVQSSWFPLVDRNPQKFVDIGRARPEDFQKATQRVYRSPANPSSVQLLVIR